MPVHESEDLRKIQILKAAFSCFSNRGFDSVTVDEIAKEAGLSKGAVYWYYRSKDDLIVALCEDWIHHNDQALFKMALECDLDQLLYQYPQYLFSQSGMTSQYKFFFHVWARSTENPNLKDRLAAMYLQHRVKAGDYIRTAITKRILKPDVDPEALARQIIALFDGLVVQWHYDQSINLAEHWKLAIDNLLHGIGLTMHREADVLAP